MSRRVSRVGTADKPPSVEETLARLEVKMKEMELKMELQEKEKESQTKERYHALLGNRLNARAWSGFNCFNLMREKHRKNSKLLTLLV